MPDITGGKGNENAKAVRRIVAEFYNDCAYFNTKTQRCEKLGLYCKGYIAKKCKYNTAPKNYDFERRYKIPEIIENNTKTPKENKKTSVIKIAKLPINRTFLNALYSGALGKVKHLPADKEAEVKNASQLVKNCARKHNIIIDYDLNSVPQYIINDFGEKISIGDVVEVDATNNIRAFVLQFLKFNDVFLVTINRKLTKTSVKSIKKMKKIHYQ